jgi:hypothetical protein
MAVAQQRPAYTVSGRCGVACSRSADRKNLIVPIFARFGDPFETQTRAASGRETRRCVQLTFGVPYLCLG